ncbi:hypothetical protein MRX96_026827 [Rhipicephalus microplus]
MTLVASSRQAAVLTQVIALQLRSDKGRRRLRERFVWKGVSMHALSASPLLPRGKGLERSAAQLRGNTLRQTSPV